MNARPTDLALSPPNFADTSMSVTAVSAAGLAFLATVAGVGAVSVKLPKSRVIELIALATDRGVVAR